MSDRSNILPALWPDPKVRAAACRLLADSIIHAHKEEPGAWVVTLRPDAVRLNVGQVAMLTVRPDDADIYFRKPASFRLPPGAEQLYKDRRSVYSERAVPSAVGMVRVPLSGLRSLSAGFLTAHHAAISSAAEAKRRSPWKSHFAESTLRALEEAVGTPLPRPDYLRNGSETVAEADIGEEAIGVGTFPDGAARIIRVNAYERNPEVRRICLERHGTRCIACEMTFAEKYGPDAAGFIHVHHLRQLSSVGPGHRVDPVADLRPVCPNCHAAIHLRTPPYSIEEVRQMLSGRVIETEQAEQGHAPDAQKDARR